MAHRLVVEYLYAEGFGFNLQVGLRKRHVLNPGELLLLNVDNFDLDEPMACDCIR